MSVAVSIIMPCFNGGHHLARSTASVLQQDLTDWELIIVDDGSTDTTWSVITELARREPRIVPLKQSNGGAAAARNAGIEAARGTMVAFLDCDDTWHPTFLSRMRAALAGQEHTAIAYCGWQNLRQGTKEEAPFIPPDYETPTKIEALLTGCRWPIHGAMVSRDALREAGGFDTSLVSSEDYDLWLRLACTKRLVRVPEVLAFYHFHGDTQLTSNLLRMERNHVRVQRRFVRTHPEEAARLGPAKLRALIEGEMHYRAFSQYWHGDLSIARALFRSLMKRGYGNLRDWAHMLPALLPIAIHRFVLRRLRTDRGPSPVRGSTYR